MTKDTSTYRYILDNLTIDEALRVYKEWDAADSFLSGITFQEATDKAYHTLTNKYELDDTQIELLYILRR
jgi:hypothetical protein